MDKIPAFKEVSWQDIGSTYDKDTLISRLYLENKYLFQQRERFSVGKGQDLPTGNDLKAGDEFAFVRQYLRETPPDSDSDERHLVLANEYPSLRNQYANGFVHRRVKKYQEAGLKVDVVAFGKRVRKDVYVYDGVNVLSGHNKELIGLLASRKYKSLSVHFMNSEIWSVIKKHIRRIPSVIVYIHGFEARNWSRLPYDINEVATLHDRIERSLRNRDLWQEIVAPDSGVTDFSFVSSWWKQAVEEDLGIKVARKRAHIIHNVIDTDLFDYQKKASDLRFNILWVRNARAWNYGADIAADLLDRLRATDFWSKIRVTVIGEGRYLEEFDRFRDEHNVRVERGFISQNEISSLHKTHGLFLVPSRFDTQGVSRDEAMSSGLVPVTTSVTAIPEFVDDDCAILGDPEEAENWVNRICQVLADPNLFQRMSGAAAHRVRTQSGPEQTVEREIKLMAKGGSL